MTALLGTTRAEAGDDPDAAGRVRIPYQPVDRAVTESSRGKVRSDIEAMRQRLCKGHEREQRIFYHVTVSRQWHYFWLCSDRKPHRAQSATGAKRLQRWVRDFRTQAGVHSVDCAPGSKEKCLTGTHDAGVQATAFCDGWIEVMLADGERAELRVPPAMGKTPLPRGGESLRFETGDDPPASSAAPAPPAKPAIPAHNDPRLKRPPPLPPAGSASSRAKLLVEAIRKGKPELATPFFFPQGAFRRVKAIGDPDGYFQRLLKLYREDVLELRRGLADPAHVEYVGFKPSRRVRWTPPGKEGNALPYWDAYGSEVLVRTSDGKARALRVRVMITWDDEWYVTHLTRIK